MRVKIDKPLNRAVGKAIHSYNMIEDGDRIAVGISGGKDSLALMWVLSERLSRIPIKYKLFGIYIDLGFKNSFTSSLVQYCEKMGYNFRAAYTDYGILAHSDENRENPCFLCSRLRRKHLFEIADELGCNKLALGHNKDDLIETLFINICYSGEISTMLPSQPMFRGKFEIIRPLAFTDNDIIHRVSKRLNFPDFINPCPSSKKSKRKEIKQILTELYRSNPKIKGNIFRAMSNVKINYLLKK
ncbi:tRNA 2-thiocytidine biosynthesis protein TtcA [Candidatus Magnetomoraceae bacterium gMMP-15]